MSRIMHFVDILKHTKIGITITENCVRWSCKENKQIAEYLGEKWNVEHNHKLRTVIDLLLNHGKIKQVNAKPMVLQYIDEEYHLTHLTYLTQLLRPVKISGTLYI